MNDFMRMRTRWIGCDQAHVSALTKLTLFYTFILIFITPFNNMNAIFSVCSRDVFCTSVPSILIDHHGFFFHFAAASVFAFRLDAFNVVVPLVPIRFICYFFYSKKILLKFCISFFSFLPQQTIKKIHAFIV